MDDWTYWFCLGEYVVVNTIAVQGWELGGGVACPPVHKCAAIPLSNFFERFASGAVIPPD